MMELDEIQKEILNLVLFAEEFDTIVSESKLTSNPNIVADVIKELIHKKLVVPGTINQSGHFEPGNMYNTDRMSDYQYCATARGVKLMSG